MSLITTALVGMLLLADPQNPSSENATASRYVLLEFTSASCGPCQQMSPLIHRLQRQGYPIRQIDVNEHPEFTSRCNVNSMPTFIMVADKKEVTRFVGARSERELVSLFQKMEQKFSAQDEAHTLADTDTNRDVANPEKPKSRRPFFRVPFAKVPEDQDSFDLSRADIRANNASIGSEDDKTALEETTAIEPPTDPLGASVRLRVKDSQAVSLGSGTIIHSEAGRSIILTCAHIFRHIDDNSRVEVDIFINGQSQSYIGTVLASDHDADVGVLSVETETPMKSALLQTLDKSTSVGNQVFSIGCGGGDDPTVQKLKITALNRYLGPDNVECTGLPVQGRSGGGLFNADGEIIGVCIAADDAKEPKDQRGLYAGLKPIYQLLERAKLIETTHDVGETTGRKLNTTSPSADEIVPEDNELTDAVEEGVIPDVFGSKQPADDSADAFGRDAAGGLADSGISEEEIAKAAGLDSLEGAEVVCIIRPVKESRAASRVVIIHRASPKFINYLTEEVSLQPRPTSARVPHKPLTTSNRPKFISSTPAPTVQPMDRSLSSTKYQRYQRTER